MVRPASRTIAAALEEALVDVDGIDFEDVAHQDGDLDRCHGDPFIGAAIRSSQERSVTAAPSASVKPNSSVRNAVVPISRSRSADGSSAAIHTRATAPLLPSRQSTGPPGTEST